jgi:hypothetical protein
MRGAPFPITDFSGGLNSKAAPYLLEPNQARDLLNVQSLTDGGIVKRDGLVTFATPANTLTSLYGLEATATDFLIGTGNQTIYSISSSGTVTSRQISLTRDARWEWVQAQPSGGQGPLFGSNGIDTPQQWDGVAGSMSAWSATSGSVPRAAYLTLHANYIYAAGVTSAPDSLFWCNIVAGTGTDARDWPATNIAKFDPNDGDQITGLGKTGALLLVFKRRKVFAVYDPSTGANRRISDSIGCVSHRSIAETPGGTFFLSESGVYRTNGSAVELVSDAITPTLALLNMTNAAGVYWNNHYYLSFPGSGVTLDFDLTKGSWWVHSISSNQFAIWHGTGSAVLYSAKSSSAVVDQCLVSGTSTDNGAAMQWFWKGPGLSPAGDLRRTRATPYRRKRWRQIRVEGFGTVDFSIAKDSAPVESLVRADIFPTDPSTTFAGSGTFGGAGSTFGGGAAVQRADLHSLGVARVLSVVVGATSRDRASIYSMTHLVTDRSN